MILCPFLHQINIQKYFQAHVYCFGVELPGSPINITVIDPPVPQPSPNQPDMATGPPQLEFAELTEPMAVGSLVEVQVCL